MPTPTRLITPADHVRQADSLERMSDAYHRAGDLTTARDLDRRADQHRTHAGQLAVSAALRDRELWTAFKRHGEHARYLTNAARNAAHDWQQKSLTWEAGDALREAAGVIIPALEAAGLSEGDAECAAYSAARTYTLTQRRP